MEDKVVENVVVYETNSLMGSPRNGPIETNPGHPPTAILIRRNETREVHSLTGSSSASTATRSTTTPDPSYGITVVPPRRLETLMEDSDDDDDEEQPLPASDNLRTVPVSTDAAKKKTRMTKEETNAKRRAGSKCPPILLKLTTADLDKVFVEIEEVGEGNFVKKARALLVDPDDEDVLNSDIPERFTMGDNA